MIDRIIKTLNCIVIVVTITHVTQRFFRILASWYHLDYGIGVLVMRLPFYIFIVVFYMFLEHHV